MKRTLKFALLASAAAFVLGVAGPSQAQQDNMRATGATGQNVYQQSQAGRYATARYDDYGTRGYDAYAFVPLQPGALEGCMTEGSYGQGIDYSACNGAD